MQKSAYDMRISDWSSDVCSSDLQWLQQRTPGKASVRAYNPDPTKDGWESQHSVIEIINDDMPFLVDSVTAEISRHEAEVLLVIHPVVTLRRDAKGKLLELAAPKQAVAKPRPGPATGRSEEQTSELQSLMRTSYAVFCLNKTTNTNNVKSNH